MDRRLRLFLGAVLLLGVAAGIAEPTFNNFLNDGFDLDASARGRLEIPREMPGLLTAMFAGMLFFLPETMVAAVAAAALALGLIGLGILGSQWWPMIVFMFLWSAGQHLAMSVHSSITMDLAGPSGKGRLLGQMRGATIAAALIGSLLVVVGMRLAGLGYTSMYILAGLCGVGGAVLLARLRMPGAHLAKPKFVWKREYAMYYVLCLFHGARKQIFLTFGPWVLVREFGQTPSVFATLKLITSVIGIWFQPMVGRAIDRFGERRILMVEAIGVYCVCVGYAMAILLPDRGLALGLLFVCYSGDELLFGLNMARTTYMSKIAMSPAHVSPSLSMGVSIDHIVSMSVPTFGGLLWLKFGAGSVFLAGALVAAAMYLVAGSMRRGAPPR